MKGKAGSISKEKDWTGQEGNEVLPCLLLLIYPYFEVLSRFFHGFDDPPLQLRRDKLPLQKLVHATNIRTKSIALILSLFDL